jgi:hypothetical protein
MKPPFDKARGDNDCVGLLVSGTTTRLALQACHFRLTEGLFLCVMRVQTVEEMPQSESERAWASGPNPKFALPRGTLGANFGFDKDTSKFMILVSFMVQKFARWTRGNDGANF